MIFFERFRKSRSDWSAERVARVVSRFEQCLQYDLRDRPLHLMQLMARQMDGRLRSTALQVWASRYSQKIDRISSRPAVSCRRLRQIAHSCLSLTRYRARSARRRARFVEQNHTAAPGIYGSFSDIGFALQSGMGADR
jgi:hypothetical protein